MPNLIFSVEISDHALAQYRNHLIYLAYHLENPFAAKNLDLDFTDALRRLSISADGFAFMEDPELHARGYHIMHLKHHKYYIIYHIDHHTAVIDAIIHSLQDYSNILK